MLTEAQKQEMVDAANRAVTYLLEMCNRFELVYTPRADGYQSLKMFGYRHKYLSRCTPLIKGSTQPPHLYRRQRRAEVKFEAWRIAQETGASHQDVEETFLYVMGGFIGQYP